MFNMGLPYKMKKSECRKQAFQNVVFQKIMVFANLKNGGTAIQSGTLYSMSEIL